MITLNLLPPQDKKKITQHYLIFLSKDAIFSLLLLCAVLGIIFLICYLILIKNFIQINQGALSVMKSNEIITEEVRKINKDLRKVEDIQEKNINWPETLLALSDLVAADEIQITNLEIDHLKNLITLEGKALTRNNFLILKKNLEESDLFINIKSPLSNLLLAENLNFSLEIELKTIKTPVH